MVSRFDPSPFGSNAVPTRGVRLVDTPRFDLDALRAAIEKSRAARLAREARESRELELSLEGRTRPVVPPDAPVPPEVAEEGAREPDRGAEFGSSFGSGVLENFADAGKGLFDAATTKLIPESVVEALPGPLEPVGRVVREITTPLDIALILGTAGLGPGIAAGLRGAGVAGRVAAGFAEPLVAGSLGRRVAAETALTLGSAAGGSVGAEVGGTPGAIGGALLGGGLIVAAFPRAAAREAAAVRPARGARQPIRSMARYMDAADILARADEANGIGKNIGASGSPYARPLKWAVEAGGGIAATLQPDDTVSRAILVHMNHEDQAPNLIVRNTSPFRAVGKLFEVDESGNVTNVGGVEGASRQLSQVFEDAFETGVPAGLTTGTPMALERGADGLLRNARFGYVFTDEQAEFIRQAQEVMADGAALLRENGIEFNETMLEGQGSRFFARFTESIRDVDTRAVGRNRSRRFGAEPTSLKRRSYIGQEIERGAANGVDYVSDPVAILETYQAGVYRAVRDKIFSDTIKKTAVRQASVETRPVRVAAEAAGREARAARDGVKTINRAIRGEKLPGATRQRLRSAFPELADELDALLGPVPRVDDIRDFNRSVRSALSRSDFVGLARNEEAVRIAPEILELSERAASMPRAELNALKKAVRDRLSGNLDAVRTERGDVRTRRAELRALRDRASGIAESMGVRAREAEGRRAARVTTAQRSQAGEAQVRDASGNVVATFRDDFFDEATTKRIQRQLGLDKPNLFERIAESSGQAGDLMRVTRAGFDTGAPLLQGLPFLATNPDKWARGVVHSFRALANPLDHQRFIAEKVMVVDDMLRRGVPLSGAASDYYDALKAGAPFERLVSRIPVVGAPIGRVASAFQRSFDALGDYARITQWEALRDMAALRGEEGLNQLAQYLRNSTGATSLRALGINPSQQAIERGFLFFSPRYTRASIALIMNAFQGGVQGELARRAFRNMAMGGLGVYVFAAGALGQEPKLNPTRGDFLTLKIGNDRVGIGSFWTSFVRLIGSTTATAFDDPGALLSDSTRDNPIVRWIRGRTAPATGLLWDFVTGSDFIGAPVGHNPVAIAKHVGEESLPFAVEAALLQRPSKAGPIAVGAELFGARTFPLSLTQRRNILRDQLGERQFGKPWENLNRLERERLENGNPGLLKLTNDAREDRVFRGQEIDRQVDEFFGEFERANDAWRDTVLAGYDRVQVDAIDLPRFRTDVLDEASQQRRARIRATSDNPRFNDVREWLAELPKRPGVSPEKPEDHAYNEYVRTVVADPDLNLPEGFDFTERDKRVGQFRARWGDDVYAYVLERLDEGREIPPIVKEFWDGRDRFGFYWQAVEDRVIGARADAVEVRTLHDLWERATENGRKNLEDANPNLSSALRTMSRVRSHLRTLDPELDVFLFRWGYTTTLRHRANQFDGAREVARFYTPRNSYILDPAMLEEAAA